MKHFSINWVKGHYIMGDEPNPTTITSGDLARAPHGFLNEDNGFTCSDIQEIDSLDIGESKRIEPGDILVTRLFDLPADEDEETYIKQRILDHITDQLHLRAVRLKDHLAKSDSDYRLRGTIQYIQDCRELYDYVSRDHLTIGTDFDLALNEIEEPRVMNRVLEYYMHYLSNTIKDILATNDAVQFEDISMFANILDVVARVYNYGIMADHDGILE